MRNLEDFILAASMSDHPFRDASDCVKDELNRGIREEINQMLNVPPTPRDLEIAEILKEEKQKWESDKLEFESNPIHWSNNKRRFAGLPVVRGKANKYRAKKFRSFKPTPRVFFAIEDVLDEMISNKFSNSEFFNQFVDVKDIALGDSVEVYHA